MLKLCKCNGYVKVICPDKHEAYVISVLENSLCNSTKYNVRFYDLIRWQDNEFFVMNIKIENSLDLFTLLTFHSKCCQVVPQTLRGYLYRLWKFRQKIK